MRATTRHQLLTGRGWKSLADVLPGERIAVVHRIPEPAFPEVWPDARVALLGHLIGDGCTLPRHAIQYTTCEPELAERLRATYPAIRPGYHLNKRHWNTVTLDGSLPDETVADMLEDSYDLVVAGLPKKVQAELGWPPGAAS